jgi:hypothetical protein
MAQLRHVGDLELMLSPSLGLDVIGTVAPVFTEKRSVMR